VKKISEKKERGSTEMKIPKMPEIKLNEIFRKRPPKTNKNKLDIKGMTDVEFDGYLKEMLLSGSTDFQQTDSQIMPTQDVEEMCRYLKKNYESLRRKEANLFQDYIKYGTDLAVAKKRFKHYKIQAKCKDKWTVWIENRTGWSSRYTRQLIEVADLVKDYPKLKRLNVKFTEFYDLRKKIVQVFLENEQIRSFWMVE